MVLRRLKEQTNRGHGRAPTLRFRMAYYAFCILIAGAIVGVLYLGNGGCPPSGSAYSSMLLSCC